MYTFLQSEIFVINQESFIYFTKDSYSLKTILEILPAEQLKGLVSHFSYKEMLVSHAHTVPAYTEQFLEFYLQGTYRVIEKNNVHSFDSPPAIFIAQQTTRNWDLVIQGAYKMFSVHFKPTGFHRLFRFPMNAFTDKATDPSLALDQSFRKLQQQMNASGSVQQIVELLENFLMQQMQKNNSLNHRFTEVINYIVSSGGDVNLNYIVNQCNITVRQFERRFYEQVGIPPKLFIKKTRFNHLLQLKKLTPEKNWTELTYLAGYFDQSHMIKDFKSFTSETPSRYIKKIQAIPEIKIF